MAKGIVAEELTSDILRSELSYNPETGEFRRLKTRGRWKAGAVSGCVSKSTGYVVIAVCGQLYFAHRLAWLYVYGKWPSVVIDHINRCQADNRIENLRSVDRSGNLRNQRIRTDNTSGVPGIHWYKARSCWRVRGFKDRKEVWLGDFCNINDAIMARRSWEAKNPIEPIEGFIRPTDNMAYITCCPE